jgi:hypothetical protein
MGRHQIATLARFTLLEAARTRLAWVFLTALLLVFAAAYFMHQLAITESTRMLIAFSAAATRIVAVFVLSLFVLTSLVREFNDKGLELTLSFDLRRADYVIGRFAGFAAIAFAMALMAGLPQMLLAPFDAALQWTCSLAFELVMVAALSIFSILTFTHLMPAASFIAGFYLLARAISGLRLISANPIVGADSPSNQVMAKLIDAFALVLPSLDRFTQSAWLLDGSGGWQTLSNCAAQAIIYTSLLIAAAMFDFYRRNL